MSTLFSTLFFLLGVFSFSYVLWKKLREDYPNEKIFKFTIAVFFGLLFGWWLSVTWFPFFSFWVTILTPFLAGTYVHRRLGLRFFEIIDALAPAWFTFLFFSYSGVLFSHFLHNNSVVIKTPTLFVIIEIILAMVSALLFRYLQTSYRRFSWYPSGKVGFAGLGSLTVYFLVRSMINFIANFISQTTLVNFGRFIVSTEAVNAIIGLALTAFCFCVLYSRSGRNAG